MGTRFYCAEFDDSGLSALDARLRALLLGLLAGVARNDKAAVLAAFQRFVQQALGFSSSGGSALQPRPSAGLLGRQDGRLGGGAAFMPGVIQRGARTVVIAS